VIVRVDLNAIGSVRALMRARGDRPIRFHGGISAFTVRSHPLEALANNPPVLSISVDATLDAHQIASPGTFLPSEQVVRDSVRPSSWVTRSCGGTPFYRGAPSSGVTTIWQVPWGATRCRGETPSSTRCR